MNYIIIFLAGFLIGKFKMFGEIVCFIYLCTALIATIPIIIQNPSKTNILVFIYLLAVLLFNSNFKKVSTFHYTNETTAI